MIRTGPVRPGGATALGMALLAALWACLACPGVREAQGIPLDDVRLAQRTLFPFDNTATIQEVMAAYSYFSNVVWKLSYDANNRKVVEARGYFDMAKVAQRTDAATCVNARGVSVGLTDDSPFLILQFRPDFTRQKATLVYCGVWGLHGGGRLDDVDFLWAKALVSDELPSPAPLCAMGLDELSPADKLAIQQTPAADSGGDESGPPRQAPAPSPSPPPPAKSAIEATSKSQGTPPTPTKTTR